MDNYLDLAVIQYPPEKINEKQKQAKLECSKTPQIGHPVGAFGHPWNFSYTGTKGIISVDRGHLTTVPNNMQENSPLTDKDVKLEDTGGQARVSHMGNWINRVKDRGLPICHEEIGHRSASICHLGNIGYQVRRELTWDPKAEHFVNDKAANKLLSREMRGDWKLG